VDEKTSYTSGHRRKSSLLLVEGTSLVVGTSLVEGKNAARLLAITPAINHPLAPAAVDFHSSR